jgi:hypothetical protein
MGQRFLKIIRYCILNTESNHGIAIMIPPNILLILELYPKGIKDAMMILKDINLSHFYLNLF